MSFSNRKFYLFSWIFEDENGNVNKNTDFPRVFLLMHMWFMESVGLAETLYELYQKNEDHQPQHPIAYRLRICHVLKYKNFSHSSDFDYL